MWAARVLERRVDKDNARTFSLAKSKKPDARTFSNRGISRGWLPHAARAQLWCLLSILLKCFLLCFNHGFPQICDGGEIQNHEIKTVRLVNDMQRLRIHGLEQETQLNASCPSHSNHDGFQVRFKFEERCVTFKIEVCNVEREFIGILL